MKCKMLSKCHLFWLLATVKCRKKLLAIHLYRGYIVVTSFLY